VKQVCKWQYKEGKMIYCYHRKSLEEHYGFAQVCRGKLYTNCPLNQKKLPVER